VRTAHVGLRWVGSRAACPLDAARRPRWSRAARASIDQVTAPARGAAPATGGW